MTTSKRGVDRRVQRTRQMLQQAFREVVLEKGFAATSIQDITERANVNRGTFYLHYTDKYMLVETFVREDFQRLLIEVLPATASWNRRTLRFLVQTLADYFEKKYHHEPRIPHSIAPLIESALQEELTRLLMTWLKQSTSKETSTQVPLEIIARIVSWAIFGAIIQWSQEETMVTAEQMTNHILLVILEGVAPLVPNALPE